MRKSQKWLLKAYLRATVVYSAKFATWQGLREWLNDYSCLYAFDTIEIFREE